MVLLYIIQNGQILKKQQTNIYWLLKAMGIVGGDSFRGNDNITRGEACAMIYRAFVNE